MIININNQYDVIVDDVATDTDCIVDDTLYLSQEYENINLNDIYSMLVSVRNCLILLIFVVFLFECHKILKNAFKRHYKV